MHVLGHWFWFWHGSTIRCTITLMIVCHIARIRRKCGIEILLKIGRNKLDINITIRERTLHQIIASKINDTVSRLVRLFFRYSKETNTSVWSAYEHDLNHNISAYPLSSAASSMWLWCPSFWSSTIWVLGLWWWMCFLYRQRHLDESRINSCIS